MQVVTVEGIPRLHAVTEFRLTFVETGAPLLVELQDGADQPMLLTFSTPCAFRVTAKDCFIFYEGLVRTIVQGVLDSPWLKELSEASSRMGVSKFTEGCRHFVVPAYDRVVEIASRDLKWAYQTEQH